MSYLNASVRTPFWGPKTPNEFKYIQNVFNAKFPDISITKACYRDLFKTVVFNLENLNSESQLKLVEKIIEDASKKHLISFEVIIRLYTSIYRLVGCSLKSSIKQDIIKADLLDFLKLPEEFVSDFMTVTGNNRQEYIEKSLACNYPKYPAIASIEWRIDVSISSSSVTRGLLPTIVIKMQLSDGRSKTFEMNLQIFHSLRYNVALVLKEMFDIQNRQIFKLNE